MNDLAATAFKPTRANQQLVEQQRRDEAQGRREQRLHARLTALGRGVRAAFDAAGAPLPLLAVQTHFSLLEGTASPQAWALALSALADEELPAPPDRRGANHPGGAAAVAQATALIRAAPAPLPPPPLRPTPRAQGPVWAALADRGDLAGLPATMAAWGRERLAAGTTISFAGRDIVLLAADAVGWAALCRLLTARHTGVREERLVDGGCAGLVALVRDERVGRRFADAGAEVLWRAGLRPETGAAPFPIAAVPLLTHLDDDRELAPVLRAVRERGTVDPRTPSGASIADLVALPAAYRGYEDQLARGADLRARRWFLPPPRILHLPPLPPDRAGLDPDAELRRLAEAGIPGRYGPDPSPAVRRQLEHELAVIRTKNFASYLLTVHWIVQGRKTCGRGSAASSIVVYLLGITNVDPLRWNLLFDRFLSPEREDPPDVDVDFAWDERDEVFSRIIAGFGVERVGVVATHQHMSWDGAFREAARAHGLADGQISAIGGRIHDLDRYGVDRDGRREEDLPEPWPRILPLVEGLRDAPRNFGVHCGGVVITEGPLGELVPVHPAAKRVPVVPGAAETRPMPAIAWEKDGAEDLGLVKIDVLGNRSLAVVRDCLADLAAQGCPPEDGWNPLDDPRTKKLLALGDTIGCFYVESPAMRQLQAKVADGGFDRLVVHSSIIRPAGMAFIRAYIERHKRKMAGATEAEIATWYPHPALAGLLSESYGVLSYQEDVMVVAQKLAGFTPAEANKLRKALGRDDTAKRLEALVERFKDGCRRNPDPVSEDTIDLVWSMISSFAGYSFAKAHSASYAAVSMECVWLKAHRPAVFLARVIANEGGFYHRSAYVEEARRRGIAIRAPCVAVGAWATRGRHEANDLRLGFHCVRGLSRATADAIVARRPFAGVRDLVRRTGCSRDEAQALLEAGAFDALLPGRDAAQRAWTVAAACNDRGPTARAAQQTIDFDGDFGDPAAPRLPALDARALLRARHDRLGALPDGHPLWLYELPRRPALRVAEFHERNTGTCVSLVAMAIARKDVNAISGEGEEQRVEDMAFVSFEDETGVVETVWFPETYRRWAVLLERGEPLLLTGTVQEEQGVKTFEVRRAAPAAG